MKSVRYKFVDQHLSDADKTLLLPTRQSPLASGFDLASAHKEEVHLFPDERLLISTGIAVEIPEGLEGQVRSRSGLAIKHGVIVLNAPGTIDADYRGEIKVVLANFSKECFSIKFGMRVAQLVFAPVFATLLAEAVELSQSQRNEAGFGSTGL